MGGRYSIRSRGPGSPFLHSMAHSAKGNSYFWLVIDDIFITDSKATQTFSFPSKSPFSIASHQCLLFSKRR